MTTLVTIFFDLALPWLLWILWRAAVRADEEVVTLTQHHCFANAAESAADEASKPDSARAGR